MFRVVQFQFVTSLLVAALAWTTSDEAHAAISALLGGLACTLPNGLFALHVALLARKGGHPGQGAAAQTAQNHAVVLLLGEFFKVVLTAVFLALIVLGYRQAVWPALMASVCAVLMVQPVAYAWRRH